MTAWDAARAASKRPLRKPYKACAPVGMKLGPVALQAANNGVGHYDQCTADLCRCHGCGYHVCSCERLQPPTAIAAPQWQCPTCWKLVAGANDPAHASDCMLRHSALARSLANRLDIIGALNAMGMLPEKRSEAIELLLTGALPEPPPEEP